MHTKKKLILGFNMQDLIFVSFEKIHNSNLKKKNEHYTLKYPFIVLTTQIQLPVISISFIY